MSSQKNKKMLLRARESNGDSYKYVTTSFEFRYILALRLNVVWISSDKSQKQSKDKKIYLLIIYQINDILSTISVEFE